MTRLLFTIIFTLTFLISLGQTKKKFPNLTQITIDTTYHVVFGYDKTKVRLINKPCYLLSKKDPFHCYKDSIFATWTIVAKIKNENYKDSLMITYSEGMSADPGFMISTNTEKIIGRFSCVEFYITGSGTIYTAGHVNNMYNRKRKFQITKDTVSQIEQPYNYVGLKGKTLKAITLYKDKTGADVVAQVPKDYEIEILLAESTTGDFEPDLLFLVKTDFGLVGWLRLSGFAEQVLEGLYYKGD